MLATLWNVFWKARFFNIVGLQSSFLQLLCLRFFKTDLARFFFLVSLGGNDYPWEIFGMNLVTTGLYGPEFHFTTIIDSCLPSEVAHLCSCHNFNAYKAMIPLLTTIIDFMVFNKSLCLNDNPALLAKFGNFLWENWIPISSRVRLLDILKLMAL